MTMPTLKHAVDLLQQAQCVVALTGAGVSTPSGIPDFRSPASGLWEHTDPAEVASLHAFRRDAKPFYRWIAPVLDIMEQAQPNRAHYALAELERRGCLSGVITQNIDGLHQRAGSRNVIELHGNVQTATCIQCGWHGPVTNVMLNTARQSMVPLCYCGGPLKPDVVLFDEELPYEAWNRAVDLVAQCDLLLIAGTGLEVYPAGELPHLALEHGAHIIVINFDATWIDDRASVVLHADVANVLP